MYSFLTKFEYDKVNDIVSFSMLLSSLMILLWLSSSSFKWSAMKRVNEEKYEKVIRFQETIENELSIIWSKSHDNLAVLNQMIGHLPNMLGQVVTRTDDYTLKDNKLLRESKRYRGYFSSTKVEDLYIGYESFQEPLRKINDVLKDISDSRIRYIYARVNKCVGYESFQLTLFVKARLDYELIEGDRFRAAIEEKIKKLSHLSDKFKKFCEISGGWLSKEEFVEEYNKYGGSNNYESIVKYAEDELEEELLVFNASLRRKLEDAIHSHIVLEQYLNLSHKNSQFNLLKMITNFITK